MSHHIGLQILRAKIRGFEVAGRTLSFRISKAKVEKKNSIRYTKFLLGVQCRHHLVAYGLLRGLPYTQIEKCSPNNKLNAKLVYEIMLAHASWQQKMGASAITLEGVKELLQNPAHAVNAVPNEPSLTVTNLPSASPLAAPEKAA